MRLMVAGCSFSSGWGFSNSKHCWPNILSDLLGCELDNRAVESANNTEIFLQSICNNKHYDLILVQWTALGRISLSPDPLNSSVIVSHPNHFFDASLEGITTKELEIFHKIMALTNGDWKHYFHLTCMIEELQKDPRIVFINGLLHWNKEFFDQAWRIPLQSSNQFIKNLLTVDKFDDDTLSELVPKIIAARDKIDHSKWVNLTSSWQQSKIDSVSLQDRHPGPASQTLFSTQVYNFLKEHYA